MSNVVCFGCRNEVLLCTCNAMSRLFNRVRASLGIYVENNQTYEEKVNTMTKTQLFQEMDEFAAIKKMRRPLTMTSLRNGKVLFNKLAEVADLPETKRVFANYSNHLAILLERINVSDVNNVVDLQEFKNSKKKVTSDDNAN